MKIIKKNICLIAILSGVVGLSACSQDDALTSADGAEDNGNTIRFTTAIAGFTGSDVADNPGTRATIDPEDGTGSFTADDKTTIFVATEGAPEAVSIHSAIFRNGTWEADNLMWDGFTDGAELNFHAFFPARTYMETLQDLTLPTDQSTSEQYTAADLLHASALRRVQGSGAVPLDFRHVMHRLTVSLSLSATPGTLTQEDVNKATVVIKNMRPTGAVNYDGKVTTHRTLSDFTPLQSTDGGGNRFRAILFPQPVVAGTPWIEITVGDRTVTYAIPATLTELEGGKEQVVNLKLTNAATTAKAITLSGQKNAVTAGVGGKAEYDISTTDIDISNYLLFATEATYTWYAAAEGGEPISPPTGIIGYNLTSENDSKGVFDVKFLKTLSAGDYYFTVTYGGATSNRVKLTVG